MQQRGRPRHRFRHVGVEVERHGDGHRVTDRGAHGGEQIAFAVFGIHGSVLGTLGSVLGTLRNHRAVEIQEHAVEQSRGTQVREETLRDVAIDVLGHAPGG